LDVLFDVLSSTYRKQEELNAALAAAAAVLLFKLDLLPHKTNFSGRVFYGCHSIFGSVVVVALYGFSRAAIAAAAAASSECVCFVKTTNRTTTNERYLHG